MTVSSIGLMTWDSTRVSKDLFRESLQRDGSWFSRDLGKRRKRIGQGGRSVGVVSKHRVQSLVVSSSSVSFLALLVDNGMIIL